MPPLVTPLITIMVGTQALMNVDFWDEEILISNEIKMIMRALRIWAGDPPAHLSAEEIKTRKIHWG